MPGTSRFFFDGNGNIVGQTAITGGGTTSTAVGTYNIALDCTATITLSGGATFDAVVAGAGSTVLFLETDSSGNAAIGSLRRSASCVSLNYPQSFAFSFSGATQAAPASGGSGSGGSGGSGSGGSGGSGGSSGSGSGGSSGAAAASAFSPLSEIGTISTDGNGSFAFTQSLIQNGAVVRSRAGGTYTVGADCSLKLTFSPTFPGTTANFKAPSSLSGLTVDSTGGLLVMQPDANTTLTGTFIVQ
jgi:hypothetical protein